MTPFRVLLGGLMLVAVILTALNPGEEAFKEFLQEKLAAEAAGRAAEATGNVTGGVADFLADRLGRAVGEYASQAFERDDYYVCSVYRIDVNGREPGGEIEFLGIANKFFPLKMPEALRDL
jgi:hypothetical protein